MKANNQKVSQKDYKMIKIKTKTYKSLCNVIKDVEKENKWLKNLLSFDSIINLILLKNKTKLSKHRFILKELKGGTA